MEAKEGVIYPFNLQNIKSEVYTENDDVVTVKIERPDLYIENEQCVVQQSAAIKVENPESYQTATNEIVENPVKTDEYFVNSNDLIPGNQHADFNNHVHNIPEIIKIKQEEPDEYININTIVKPEPDLHLIPTIIPKTELLSEECDIPIVKSENDLQSNQPSSSKNVNIARKYVKRKKQYICPVCDKKNISAKTRRNHLLSHFKKRWVICSMCGKFYTKKTEYLHHYRNHSVKAKVSQNLVLIQKSSLSCAYCTLEFSSQRELNIHLNNSHASEKPFQCHICFKRYTVLYTLRRHLPIHSSVQPYKCNICLKQFSLENLYKYHMLIHEKGKQFKCNICSKEFVQKNGLLIHQIVHKGIKFSCKICSKEYTRKVTLKSHMRLHSGEHQFKCHICQKEFMSKGGLKTHLMNHAGDRPFECNYCSMRFLEKKKLKKHLQSHEKSQLICEICSIGFLYKTRLRHHLLTVHGEKPFKCLVCPEKFENESELNKHGTTHIKIELFSCEVCLQEFRKRSSYIRHLGRHGKKPFQCEICFEQYSSEKNIREHYFAQHPGSKPFRCNECMKGFFHKRSQRKHICEKQEAGNT